MEKNNQTIQTEEIQVKTSILKNIETQTAFVGELRFVNNFVNHCDPRGSFSFMLYYRDNSSSEEGETWLYRNREADQFFVLNLREGSKSFDGDSLFSSKNLDSFLSHKNESGPYPGEWDDDDPDRFTEKPS